MDAMYGVMEVRTFNFPGHKLAFLNISSSGVSLLLDLLLYIKQC